MWFAGRTIAYSRGMPSALPPDRPAPLPRREPDPQREQAVAAVRALARASRVLERAAAGELNLAHYRVLSAIASGDQRASRIATRLALGKPTISAAVDALAQRGLLTRAAESRDGRAAALALTEEGRATLDRAENEMIARIEALCARTGDRADVMRALSLLGDAIDAAYAERMADPRVIV